MESVTAKVWCFIKKYYFLAFAVCGLMLSDLALKNLVQPQVFTEGYVKTVIGLFNFGWIFLILFLCAFVLPGRAGRAVYITVATIFVCLSFSQYVYFKIFEQFYWLKSIVLVGEGADYLSHVGDYIDTKIVLYSLASLLCIIIAASGWHRPKFLEKKSFVVRMCVLLVPILTLCGTHIYMLPAAHNETVDGWDLWRKPRVVYEQFNNANKSYEVTGLYQFTYLNMATSVFPQQRKYENKLAQADEYFAMKGESDDNSFTGLFKGKNLIVVMMESIDTWMIDEEFTPTLCKMMREGIDFTNYNAPFFGSGFTFNSEFAFNSGYFTPVSAVSASSFSKKSFPYSLAHLFNCEGYATNSFHFNDAEYYNRGVMHKSLGYDKYNCIARFDVDEVSAQLDSNMVRCDAVYEKMTEQQPFLDFIVTYSAHLPYTGDDKKLLLAKEYRPDLVKEDMDEEKNNAMILAADTDEFFKILLERLEADGLLDNTVIVAYTDHFAYGVSDQQTMLSEWKTDKLSYTVPAFIYAKGLKRQKVSKPMMTVDWLPTLVNLFDLGREGKYIGQDVLDPDNKGFVYFETNSWLDENMYYDTSAEYVPDELEDMAYVQKQNDRVKELREINDNVVLGDYFAPNRRKKPNK